MFSPKSWLDKFPLNNTQFLRLWLAQLTSQVAINMLNLVLALMVYQRTGSNAAVSFLVLAFNLPGLIFGATSGVVVDRLDKKMILVSVNFLRVILVFGFLVSAEGMASTIMLALALSILTQFFFPAEGATIPKLVGDHPQNLFRANSLFTLTFYLAIITGYITGGPLLVFLGSQGVFLLIAGLFFTAYLMVVSLSFSHFSFKEFFIRKHQNGEMHHVVTKPLSLLRQVDRDLREGFTVLKGNPTLLFTLISLGSAQMLMSVFLALGPGFAKTALKIEVTDASLLLFGPAIAGMIFGAIIINRFSHKLAHHRFVLIFVGLLSSGLALVALSFTERFPMGQLARLESHLPSRFQDFLGLDLLLVAQVFLFLLGFFEVLVDIPGNTVLQEKAGPERRGRVYGMLTTFVTGGSVIPVLFSGFIADRIGVTKVFLVFGVILVVFSLYMRGKLLKLQNS